MNSQKAIEIVIASSNLNKIREFREILKPLTFLDVTSLVQYPHYIPPEENGSTFRENAILKAESAAKALNRLVIADDSGLVVPALNGRPGVHSRRFSGENGSDSDNRKKLLEEMLDLTDLHRNAYFECVLALASPSGLIKAVEGRCEGRIIEEERGSRGFGYDSLFCKHDYEKTFAELEENVKNRISHRFKAMDRLLNTLRTLES